MGWNFRIILKTLTYKKSVRTINNSLYGGYLTYLFYNNRILKLSDIYEYTLSIYMFDHRNDIQFEKNQDYLSQNRNDLFPSLERLSRIQIKASH